MVPRLNSGWPASDSAAVPRRSPRNAKSAILIVEFAKAELERGRPLVEAALEGARLRPILMTSVAFIFGCLPLWSAAGAGSAARRMLGTTVVTGMLAATLLGIFFVPALFVFFERLAGRRDGVSSAVVAAGKSTSLHLTPPPAAKEDDEQPPRLSSVE